jgi:hypothetical protein
MNLNGNFLVIYFHRKINRGWDSREFSQFAAETQAICEE